MTPNAAVAPASLDSERGLARLNPVPRQAYELTVTLKDAPGTFAEAIATAQYDVANENECGHINSASGTAERITSNEPITLERLSDTTYKARFYLDLMQDQDYYGRGVCRWELTEVRVSLRATGAEGETYFVPSLPAEALKAGASRTTYFWRGGYPASRMRDFPDFGSQFPERFAAERQAELFSVQMEAKEG